MVTIEDIKRAHKLILPYIHRTPVLTSTCLNEITKSQLFFKCENFQKVGAFKARGACNAVFTLKDEEAKNGIATHSSGNHGAAISYAGSIRGIPSYVVMPKNSPKAKQDAVRHYGGKVIFCEPGSLNREKGLKKVVEETGAYYISSYNNEKIIMGQGTSALEFIEDYPELDIVIAPVGGGGLLAGTSVAVESESKAVTIGAEPYNVRDAYLSLKNDKITPMDTESTTVCDGLLSIIGDKNFAIIRKKVDQIITAKEETIVKAKKLIWQRMKIMIEPSSAVALAIVLEQAALFNKKKIGIILLGGNVDID